MPTAEETARGSGRGRDKGRSSTEGRLNKAFRAGDTSSTMEWADVDPRYIAWLVISASTVGGAVTFGRSRDRGALMVTVLLEGDRQTFWVSPRDNIDEKLRHICEVLESLR